MSHLNTRAPSGDDVTQRSDMKPAFSSDLFEHVLQEDNLSAAWKRVRANKGAAGIDGVTTVHTSGQTGILALNSFVSGGTIDLTGAAGGGARGGGAWSANR